MSKRVIRVVTAVIEHQDRYLITQRNESAVLPLFWEFPGGRLEYCEDDHTALRRELRERLRVELDTIECMGAHIHQYDRYEVHLHIFACTLLAGSQPQPRAVHDVRWVKSNELSEFDFPPADQSSMDKLLGLTAST